MCPVIECTLSHCGRQGVRVKPTLVRGTFRSVRNRANHVHAQCSTRAAWMSGQMLPSNRSCRGVHAMLQSLFIQCVHSTRIRTYCPRSKVITIAPRKVLREGGTYIQKTAPEHVSAYVTEYASARIMMARISMVWCLHEWAHPHTRTATSCCWGGRGGVVVWSVLCGVVGLVASSG